MTETARTYGQALYELARDEGLDSQLLTELSVVARLLRENRDYVGLLSLPSLSKQERCQIADESLRGQVHPYLLNFVKILVENGTVDQLPGCEEQFRAQYHSDHGILEVTAVTAAPLDDGLRQKLLSKLSAVTGKQVELKTRVDAAVLGGVRLEMDGRRLDGTVEHRLKELRERLRETVL